MGRKGKNHSAEEEKHGLGDQWGETTGLYCVKERGQVHPEFDSLVELKVDVVGMSRIQDVTQQPLRCVCGGEGS